MRHTFSFYDLATGRADKHIVLPNFPHEFMVDQGAQLAYVGHYGIETASHLGEWRPLGLRDRPGKREHVDTLEPLAVLPAAWPRWTAEGRLFVMSEAHNALLRFFDPLERTCPTWRCHRRLQDPPVRAHPRRADRLCVQPAVEHRHQDPAARSLRRAGGRWCRGRCRRATACRPTNRCSTWRTAVTTPSSPSIPPPCAWWPAAGRGATQPRLPHDRREGKRPAADHQLGRAIAVGVRHRPARAALREAAGQSAGAVVPSRPSAPPSSRSRTTRCGG